MLIIYFNKNENIKNNDVNYTSKKSANLYFKEKSKDMYFKKGWTCISKEDEYNFWGCDALLGYIYVWEIFMKKIHVIEGWILLNKAEIYSNLVTKNFDN